MKIDKVNINNLLPFNENPYRIREGEELESLLDSISENGIISPLVVRPTEDKGKFEVISGHRRLHAARMLNLEAVPVTVCDVSREEAAIMLVDSNLHREHILPSEKAFAYKLKLEALNHQGKTEPKLTNLRLLHILFGYLCMNEPTIYVNHDDKDFGINTSLRVFVQY